MSNNPRSSASYAYYSFPPTPSRRSSASNSPTQPRSPKSVKSAKSTKSTKATASNMPSPAAGRTPQAPTTPTKAGKNPGSNVTPKLGSAASGAAGKAKGAAGGAKSATNTPKPPKLGKPKGAAETDSPKLPPRPKAVDDLTQKAEQTATEGGDADPDIGKKIGLEENDTDEPAGKVSQAGNETGAESTDLSEAAPEPEIEDDDEDTVAGAKDTVEDTTDDAEDAAEDAEDAADEATDDAQEQAGGLVGGAKSLGGKAAGAAGGLKDTAQKTAGDVSSGDPSAAAGDVAEGVQDQAGEAVDGAQEAAGEATDQVPDAEGAVNGVKDQAEDAVGELSPEELLEQFPVDVGILKGLEVGENGEILGSDGEPLGQLDEGSPEHLAGQAVGDNGEILDEDGDVIGRVSVLPDKALELAQQAKAQADEAAADAQDTAGDAVDQAQQQVPDVGALEGLEVGEDGQILGDDGQALGKIVEGDPADFAGQKLNSAGEILDEDGDVIGRAEVLPQDLADGVQDQVDGAVDGAVDGLTPDLSIVQGKKLNKKGNVIDDEGEVLAKLAEGDPAACAGKIPNENGEILDDDGEVIGRLEIVPGEAADEAMKALHPEGLVDGAPELPDGVELPEGVALPEGFELPEGATLPELSLLEGLKVNKRGEVLNEDGDPIARVAEGEIADLAGKKLNDQGEILDADGNVIGKVEFIPEAVPDLIEQAQDQVPDQVDELLPELDLSILEGLKVNKKGEVLNEDGEPIAKLAEGFNLDDVRGKKLNEKGEVVDADGNVIGKVELVGDALEEAKAKAKEAAEAAEAAGEAAGEAAEEAVPELPPLSILDGLKCNKSGKIVDPDGNPVGELIEGDPKRLSKLGATCDAEGRFWDSKGNIIGRAQTIAVEPEVEAEFAGLEGLIVVEGGWVEDENGNRVGQLVEGDAKKLIGRAVDEDGDVIDKRGNVVGHAERYEEPEEPQPEKIDLSILNGLTCNKQGNVIGPEGVPIARLVEGNPKELAGKRIDGEGQIWNDEGQVIGRCELIPFEEREAKPEGPFAGLEGLVVVQDGFVEDEEGNRVGVVVEGDPKKLIGRAVDEDGDIIDKYGNVKGHCEPYEAPEEEAVDLSILAGKVVNKQGNVVDEHGTIFGRIVEGDPLKLAGKKVDGQGQIWSDDGKVIGQAELIPGGEQQRAEGPFSGFETVTVGEEGLCHDGTGRVVGRVIEGDLEKLLGRTVDEDGDILDKNGNVLGRAERYEEEKKEREINPMSGRKVNKEGKVMDEDGNLIGVLTEGNLGTCIGKEIDDNGYVVDNDGNRIGECTLIENLPEDEGPTDEEIERAKKEQEDKELAIKMSSILRQTLERIEPVCKQITDHIEKADRTPKEELDEEQLVNDVKPLLEEGGRILQECNGAIRGLDPDGRIAAQAKAKAASREATPEEYQLADLLKELTTTVVKTIDNAKKRIADMPHAKKKLSPLWALLTEPLFQIIAAVGLLLSGVLGLVGKLLNGLGLGGLVNGLLGGLGIDKLLGGLGLGSIAESLGLGGGKKKKK